MQSPGMFLVGGKHTIEFTKDPTDGATVAQCRGAQADFQHGKNWCDWREVYDTLDDAIEWSQDHANEAR